MQRQHRNNVPQLDLHGKTADEAESEIDRFVNEQIMQQSTNVKIIHGNGLGILRRTTLRWLDKHSELVERYVSFGPGVSVELIDIGHLHR